MSTMKDVARYAGVSLGTVSNVLNKLPTVSPENKVKVEDAIKALEYRPNKIARSLKTNSTHSLGLIIPDITNPYYPELSRGVEDTAMKHGYALVLCNNDRNVAKERAYIDFLIDKKTDGLILVKPHISAAEITDIQKYTNVVLIDAPQSIETKCDCLDVDDFEGSLEAMRVLCGFGHRRIAFIGGIESKSGNSRNEAYYRCLGEFGIGIDYSLIKQGAYDCNSGHRCMLELLRCPEAPTAVFAANDLMAIGAIKSIHDRGMRVPDDISVLGYDDISMASLCQPALTTVRQPKYEIGSRGADIAIARIKAQSTDNPPFQRIIMKTELIMRDSIGPCRNTEYAK